MKLGAEPKKVGFLVVLGLAAVYLLYTNLFPSQPGVASEPRAAHTPTATKAPAQTAAAPPATATRPAASSAGRQAGVRGSSQEFRPAYAPRVAQDLSKIDPKLRLDLLAKVQGVEAAPAERNLFQFGVAAAPALAGGGTSEHIIKPKPQPNVDLTRTAGPPAVPVAPTAPPIALKYYGFVAQRSDGHKRAFFLDGEDILVAGEGETVKRRYKVVRIGVNSVTMEDTQFNSTQTLPLAEEAAG